MQPIPCELLGCVQTFTNINRLLLTNSRFRHSKRQLYNIQISLHKLSLTLHDTAAIVSSVHRTINSVDNFWDQLRLRCVYIGGETTNWELVERLLKMQCMSSSGSVQLALLLHSLVLQFVRIVNVNQYSNLQYLGLYYCDHIIGGISLPALRTCHVCTCRLITHIDCGEYLYRLDVSDCDSITSLGNLASVRDLSLFRCVLIDDISRATNVTTLTLVECAGISDISMLTNVTKLSLYSCKNISDIATLSNVPSLTVNGCLHLTK